MLSSFSFHFLLFCFFLPLSFTYSILFCFILISTLVHNIYDPLYSLFAFFPLPTFCTSSLFFCKNLCALTLFLFLQQIEDLTLCI